MVKITGKKSNDEKLKGRVRFIIINFVRAILVIAFFGALYNKRSLVLVISITAFIFTFLPIILSKFFSIKLPAEFEVIVIFFIYGILFLGEVRGLYAEFWWWDILLNLLAATALGFIGLSVMYSLYRERKINASPIFVALFAFLFAVAIGAVWEVFEFAMDSLFGFGMQKSGIDTMKDIIVNIIGALFVSGVGYYYIKEGRIIFVSRLVSNIIEKSSKDKSENEEIPHEEVLKMIKKGEGNKLEFKSTLRKNLHTNEYDKKIEHAVLKTMVAYMNSDGGALLVGVDNNGEITGLEKDEFPDNDKLNLYFTNLIKQHIGSEYLPFINYDIICVDSKYILKVDCEKSNKHVFLKHGQEEEFYVRNGPSSAKLSGRALIDYINNKFMKV